MGIYLNSEGGLTVSQAHQADMLGISHAKYREIIMKRLEELRGGKPPTAFRGKTGVMKDNIKAKKPVLVIAKDRFFEQNLEFYKKYPWKIIVVDFMANRLFEAGIIPDYIITLESAKTSVPLSYFNLELMKPHKQEFRIIGSSITREELIAKLTEAGLSFTKFVFDEEPRCSNVGLYAVNFAIRELNADKVIMVGMDHIGSEYPEFTYRLWQTDFWYFLRKWPKETIVNCTNGGVLYYKDYIIDTTLEKLKIE